jgi:hypothetical protein
MGAAAGGVSGQSGNHMETGCSGGIQKHFMGAEIPRSDLPNRFSGLTTSRFSRDGIGKLVFKKI